MSSASSPISSLRGALERRFPEAVVALGPPAPAAVGPRSASWAEPRRPASAPSLGVVSSQAPPPRLCAGAITEIVSELGDGGTRWLLEGLAEALVLQPQRYALYVDLEGSFYPPAAVGFGVPLERLLLVRTSELTTALRAIELCLRGGAITVAALDVPKGLPPLRLSTYHRLRRRVREGGSTLVVLAREPFVPADHRVELHPMGRGDVVVRA